MAFTQAAIEVENKEAFERLRMAIESAMTTNLDRFMRVLSGEKLKVREFEGLLKAAALEKANGENKGQALAIYQSLTMSDQALMREFYLTRIEQVSDGVREKYSRLYRYS